MYFSPHPLAFGEKEREGNSLCFFLQETAVPSPFFPLCASGRGRDPPNRFLLFPPLFLSCVTEMTPNGPSPFFFFLFSPPPLREDSSSPIFPSFFFLFFSSSLFRREEDTSFRFLFFSPFSLYPAFPLGGGEEEKYSSLLFPFFSPFLFFFSLCIGEEDERPCTFSFFFFPFQEHRVQPRASSPLLSLFFPLPP